MEGSCNSKAPLSEDERKRVARMVEGAAMYFSEIHDLLANLSTSGRYDPIIPVQMMCVEGFRILDRALMPLKELTRPPMGRFLDDGKRS